MATGNRSGPDLSWSVIEEGGVALVFWRRARYLEAQPIGPKANGKKDGKNAAKFDLRTELYRITGIDWAQINGIDVLTAQTLIAETGVDLSAFPTEKQLASWLGLCSTNETSGGKVLKRRTRKVVNRASTAFRDAASDKGTEYYEARYRERQIRALTKKAQKLPNQHRVGFWKAQASTASMATVPPNCHEPRNGPPEPASATGQTGPGLYPHRAVAL